MDWGWHCSFDRFGIFERVDTPRLRGGIEQMGMPLWLSPNRSDGSNRRHQALGGAGPFRRAPIVASVKRWDTSPLDLNWSTLHPGSVDVDAILAAAGGVGAAVRGEVQEPSRFGSCMRGALADATAAVTLVTALGTDTARRWLTQQSLLKWDFYDTRILRYQRWGNSRDLAAAQGWLKRATNLSRAARVVPSVGVIVGGLALGYTLGSAGECIVEGF